MKRGIIASLGYIIFSSGATVFNKLLLSGRDEASLLGDTIMVIWLQQAAQLFILLSMMFFGVSTSLGLRKETKAKAPSISQTFLLIGPSVLLGLQVVISNFALKRVKIASYQISRSTSTFTTMMVAFVFRGERPTRADILGSMFIWIAVAFTIFDSISKLNGESILDEILCLRSIGLGVLASFVGSCYMESLRFAIQDPIFEAYTNGDVVMMFVLQQAHLTVFILPFIKLVDLIFTANYVFSARQCYEAICHFCSGCIRTSELGWLGELGLIIASSCIVVWLPICTNLALADGISPLTMTVIGFVKNCLQGISGKLILREELNFYSKWGLTFSIIGSLVYGLGKRHTKTKMT